MRLRFATIDRAAQWAVIVTLCGAIAIYAYIGRYTRYVADDYAMQIALRVRGYWATQVAEYARNGGRFSATALIGAGSLLNELFVEVLPGLLLLGWVVLGALAVRRSIPSAAWAACVALAAVVVVTTVAIMPSPFLSLYWMTGSLTYTVPLLLGTGLVLLVVPRAPPGRLRLAAVGGMAFIGGGFNETYGTAQLLAFVLLFVATITTGGSTVRRCRGVAVSGIIGAASALAVVAAAPGNVIRFRAITNAGIGARPTILTLPGYTLGKALEFFNNVFISHWFAAAAVAVLAGVIAARSPSDTEGRPRLWTSAMYVAATAVVVIVVSLAPAAWVEATLAQPYAQIVPTYAGICGIAALGFIVGRSVRHAFDDQVVTRGVSPRSRSFVVAVSSLVAATVVMVTPIANAISMWGSRPALQDYAATKDAQAHLARAAAAAGQPSVVVPSASAIRGLGVFYDADNEELVADPRYWVNVDEALYYRVGSVVASPTLTRP
jgi:Family of unknown function (DUF6056)